MWWARGGLARAERHFVVRVSAEFLLDNSAWARLGDASLPQARADEIAGSLEERRILTTKTDLRFDSV